MAQIEAQYRRLACAETTHHGTAIEMALGEAAHGKRCRRRSQNHACQGSQTEKFFCPLQRRLYFRPCVANAFDSFSQRQTGLSPCAEILHCRGIPRNQQPIANPATLLHQPGRRQIDLIDQDPRPQIDESDGIVRLLGYERGNGKTCRAKLNRVAPIEARRTMSFSSTHADPGAGIALAICVVSGDDTLPKSSLIRNSPRRG